jgi:hypothetical protein
MLLGIKKLLLSPMNKKVDPEDLVEKKDDNSNLPLTEVKKFLSANFTWLTHIAPKRAKSFLENWTLGLV